MPGRDQKPWVRAVAAIAGSLVGAGLMGGIGYTHGTDIVVGAVAGAVLLGALGHGVAVGTMGAVTLYAVLFALVVCMIGPGCDDYSGMAAIPAALVGASLGRLFHGSRRRDEAEFS